VSTNPSHGRKGNADLHVETFYFSVCTGGSLAIEKQMSDGDEFMEIAGNFGITEGEGVRIAVGG